MRTLLSLCLLLATTQVVLAQKQAPSVVRKPSAIAVDAQPSEPVFVDQPKSLGSQPAVPTMVKGASWAKMIGHTYYDLQSYGSNPTTLMVKPNGDLSIIWIYGKGGARGSRTVGYNAFNASQNRWLFTGGVNQPGSLSDSCNFVAPAYARNYCDTTLFGMRRFTGRFGWHNLISDGTTEAVAGLTANPGDPVGRLGTLIPSNGANQGSDFTNNQVSFDSLPLVRNQVASYQFAASSDGHSYLLTTLRNDSLPEIVPSKGTVNNIVIWHTTNHGQSWDPLQIPYIDAIYGLSGVRSINMAIDAKDNQVAVVAQVLYPVPDRGIGVMLFRSFDYGATWTMKQITKRTDADTSFFVGPTYNFMTDGSYSVLIDNNDVVHVTSHAGYSAQDSAGTAITSFYMNGAFGTPIGGSLLYWNDQMAELSGFVVIDKYNLARTARGVASVYQYSYASGPGKYPQAGISMSNLAVDASNNLYITYSAVVEESFRKSNTSRPSRDLFMMYSSDNGATWSSRINIAGKLLFNNCQPVADFKDGSPNTEEFYPVTQKRINADGKLHITFLSDTIVGLAEAGTTISIQQNWVTWRPNQVNYINVDVNTIKQSMIRAVLPKSVCTGQTYYIPFSLPAQPPCLYGAVTPTTQFKLEYDTSALGDFTRPIVLASKTNVTDTGSFSIQFAGLTKRGLLRIVAYTGDTLASPRTYDLSSSAQEVTFASSQIATAPPVTGRMADGTRILNNSSVCNTLTAVFGLNESLPDGTVLDWKIYPDTAGNIQTSGSKTYDLHSTTVQFLPTYLGPVTVEARAINGCGSSTLSSVSFNVVGGTAMINTVSETFNSTLTGGNWQFAQTRSAGFTNVSNGSPSILPYGGLPAGLYRYKTATCQTNMLFWPGSSQAGIRRASCNYFLPAVNITTCPSTPYQLGNRTLTAEGTYFDTLSTESACKTIRVIRLSYGQVTPGIIASGPLSLCTGDSVILTSPMADHYLWSNGDTSQQIVVKQPGSYTVRTITEGCTSLISSPVTVAVFVQQPPTITTNGPTTLCSGATLELSAPAGFNYLWSNGARTQQITVSTAGAYTVRLLTQSCTTLASAPVIVTVVQQPAQPVIQVNGPTSICSGSSVTLTGPDNLRYIWSTQDTVRQIRVSTSAVVRLQTISAGCTSNLSDPVIITVNQRPTATLSLLADSMTAQPAGASYSWLLNGQPVTGITSSGYRARQSGAYQVIVTQNGCADTSAVMLVTATALAIAQQQIILAPNPADDHTTLKLNQPYSGPVALINQIGQNMRLFNENGQDITIDLKGLSKGIYILKLQGYQPMRLVIK